MSYEVSIETNHNKNCSAKMDSKNISIDCLHHKPSSKKRKNSRWKIFDGLFTRKKLEIQSASAGKDCAFQLFPKRSPAAVSSRPSSPEGEESSQKSDNFYDWKLNSDRPTTSLMLFDLTYEDNSTESSSPTEKNFLPPFSFPENPSEQTLKLSPGINSARSFEDSPGYKGTSPRLDVEIPTTRLDRFSIMFKEPLQRSKYGAHSSCESEPVNSERPDDSHLDHNLPAIKIPTTRPESNSPYSDTHLSPLSRTPLNYQNTTLDLAQTHGEFDFQSQISCMDTEKNTPSFRMQILLPLETSNIFQEGENQEFFASTPIELRPKSPNTTLSSEDRMGTLSSPSILGSDQNISASTSLSSISPPQSATSIRSQFKQSNPQLKKSITLSPRELFPSMMNTSNISPTIESQTTIDPFQTIESSINEIVSTGFSMDKSDYDHHDRLNYSQFPAVERSLLQNSISLRTTDLAVASSLSSPTPTSVVTKSPLDAFAQAANDDLERADILLARSRLAKQVEENQQKFKRSERLGSNSNVKIPGLIVIGEEENNELSSTVRTRFMDRWKAREDINAGNKARESDINLKCIEHTPLTVPPRILMEHRRSERATVERMSFASNM